MQLHCLQMPSALSAKICIKWGGPQWIGSELNCYHVQAPKDPRNTGTNGGPTHRNTGWCNAACVQSCISVLLHCLMSCNRKNLRELGPVVRRWWANPGLASLVAKCAKHPPSPDAGQNDITRISAAIGLANEHIALLASCGAC